MPEGKLGKEFIDVREARRLTLQERRDDKEVERLRAPSCPVPSPYLDSITERDQGGNPN